MNPKPPTERLSEAPPGDLTAFPGRGRGGPLRPPRRLRTPGMVEARGETAQSEQVAVGAETLDDAERGAGDQGNVAERFASLGI